MKRKSIRKAAIAVGLLVGMQLIPLARDNPAGGEELSMPMEVREIVSRSCFDCHSNHTQWPWYSYVAPVSWGIVYHVKTARRHLNFSTWEKYRPKKRRHHLREAWEEISEGEMPPAPYLLMHGEARLSRTDTQVLRNFFDAR